MTDESNSSERAGKRQPPHLPGPLAALGLTLLCSLLLVGVVFLLSVVLRAEAAPPELVAYELERVSAQPSTFTVTPAMVRAASNLQLPQGTLRTANMAAAELTIRLGIIIATRWQDLVGTVLALWAALVSALLVAQYRVGERLRLALLWPGVLRCLPLLLGVSVVFCAVVTFLLAAPVPPWNVVLLDYFAEDPVPFFLLMLGMTALPAWPVVNFSARLAVRQHRAKRGECERCGYPRADSASTPCSECGLSRADGTRLCEGRHWWIAKTVMCAGAIVSILSLMWPAILLRPVIPTLFDSPSIVLECGDSAEIKLQHGTLILEISDIDTSYLVGSLRWSDTSAPDWRGYPIRIDQSHGVGGVVLQPGTFLVHLFGGRQVVVNSVGGAPGKVSLALADVRWIRRLPAKRAGR